METTDKPAFGNHAPDWEPSAKGLECSDAALESIGRELDARPSKSDVIAAFGQPEYIRGEDGKFTGELKWSADRRKDKHAIAKWREMSAAHRREMIRRSGDFNAQSKVPLVGPDGKQQLVFEHLEDRVCEREGMRRDTRGSAQRASVKYVTGESGMIWRHYPDEDLYEPTGRWCLGTPLDDSDPTLRGLHRAPDLTAWFGADNGSWQRLADMEVAS